METRALQAQIFCLDYINAAKERRFVLGTGDYARSVAKTLPIAAFVDDETNTSLVEGVPVIRSDAIPTSGLVVVASMLRPRSAMRSLDQKKLRALDYFAFAHYSGLLVRPVAFWPSFITDYRKNRGRYERVRAVMADAESLDTFDSIVSFRLDADLGVMSSFSFDPEGQYFEDFLELAPAGETFVDVGSFDGRTSLRFAARVPNFSHIYAFEPSRSNIPSIKRNLKTLGAGRTTVYPYGLGAKAGKRKFDASLGTSSRASDDGDTEIEVCSLDSLRLSNPTFIKMDIEGAEVEALIGAFSTIERFRPRLAIAVYHRFDDFWRIPEVISETRVDFRIYLRHYTEGIDETVMYFVPKD